METQGVGTSPEAFRAGVEAGTIVGHVGFPESIRIISDAIGLGFDRIEEIREPIVSKVRRETPHVVIEPGMVAGCAHIGNGYRGDKESSAYPPPTGSSLAEGQDTGDYIHLRYPKNTWH